MNSTSNNDIKSTRTARSGSVGYKTVANAMPASQEAAPYLGKTRVAGSCTQDDLAKKIAGSKGAYCGVEEVKRVLNAVGNYLLDNMPEELSSFDIGFAHVRPAIGGKFPSMDSAFDPERNRIYVSVTPPEEIRGALSSGSPTRLDPGEGEPMVGNVTWNDSSLTIKSGESFVVLGNALTMDVGDESAALKLPRGGGTVTVSLVPAVVGDWQRLVGNLAHGVDPCEGAELVVRTHGYDRGSSLKEVGLKNITVLAGESPSNPPRITSGHSESHADDGKCYADGSGFVLEGDNLEGALVTIAGSANEGETWSYEETIPAEKVNFDADMLTIDGNWLDSWYNHLDVGELVKFTVETTQGEDSIQRTLSA